MNSSSDKIYSERTAKQISRFKWNSRLPLVLACGVSDTLRPAAPSLSGFLPTSHSNKNLPDYKRFNSLQILIYSFQIISISGFHLFL